MVITAIYFCEFVHSFYLSSPPLLNFFRRIDTWIDIITMVTPIVTYVYQYDTEHISDKVRKIKVIRLLRVLKVLRILRLSKLLKKFTMHTTQDNEEDSYSKAYVAVQLSPISRQVFFLIA